MAQQTVAARHLVRRPSAEAEQRAAPQTLPATPVSRWSTKWRRQTNPILQRISAQQNKVQRKEAIFVAKDSASDSQPASRASPPPSASGRHMPSVRAGCRHQRRQVFLSARTDYWCLICTEYTTTAYAVVTSVHKKSRQMLISPREIHNHGFIQRLGLYQQCPNSIQSQFPHIRINNSE
ncbi:uncharacterized protein LMH87_009074 [Akanthomyces muscarius]|uniref:Uncharacterized protein n=1 Tax=Akanthomyces muscarius TaxID=2231603 RepID=A0A9W8QKG8_AKAMU|nr:uncharacterized protein LMH87_009074 [Akanthomyces muscarius]KAJ4158552.1 hypothetical protein LMH87_009074 [Akanthomyces muscarius]